MAKKTNGTAKEVAKNVDEFIDKADSRSREILKKLRQLIKEELPEAEERIAWAVPNYKLPNDEMVGMSVMKAHVSFGYDATSLSDVDKEKLIELGHKVGKMSFQIPFDTAVPEEIVRNILRNKRSRN